MFRKLFFILTLILCSRPSWAGLDTNNTIWEVRPTNGSDNNGGCFLAGSTGTDFSQQNSPQQAYTDLVAATTTTITSVARAFSSVDVGNCLKITSGTGWTTGIFQITSVSSGTATVDRSIATMGSTGGTGNLGGAMQNYSSLPGLGSTYSLTATNAYIKAESTITITTRPDFQNTSLLQVIGYTSTRGDNGRATLTTSNGTDVLTYFRGNGSLIMQNIKFTDTSGTRHLALGHLNTMNYLIVVNCLFDGNGGGVASNSGTVVAHGIIQKTEIKNQAGAGLSFYVMTGLLIEDSYIHDNTGNGLDILAASSTPVNVFINRSIFRANSTGIKSIYDGAIGSNSALYIRNCVIASNTADGIKNLGTGSHFAVITHLENNVVYGNGGFGVVVTTASAGGTYNTWGGNNAYGSNTSGNFSNYASLPGDVSLSADPFTAASSGDFTPNSTAGGGVVLKAAGLKNAVNSAATDYPDIGAIQSGSTASGTHGAPIQ